MIKIQTTVNAPVEVVWQYFTDPEHITQWSFASPEWHTPYADNDLKVGGKFKSTMAAKDGSMSFDFEGVYTDVKEYKLIKYAIADGRKVEIIFEADDEDDITKITESFEPETTNPVEMQKGGWQAILDNFKAYVEAN